MNRIPLGASFGGQNHLKRDFLVELSVRAISLKSLFSTEFSTSQWWSMVCTIEDVTLWVVNGVPIEKVYLACIRVNCQPL